MSSSKVFEFIGILGVVVSLVFVGYEIRQNTALASGQALLELSALTHENLISQTENPNINELIIRAEQDHESLSPRDKRTYRQHIYAVWNTYEVAYRFREKGILDEDDFAPWAKAMCSDYSIESVSTMVNSDAIVMHPRLMEFVKEGC